MTRNILKATEIESPYLENHRQRSTLPIVNSTDGVQSVLFGSQETDECGNIGRPEREQFVSIINDLILEFPELEQVILALYFYERLSLSDIAHLMNLDESDITRIFNRTLDEFRNRLYR